MRDRPAMQQEWVRTPAPIAETLQPGVLRLQRLTRPMRALVTPAADRCHAAGSSAGGAWPRCDCRTAARHSATDRDPAARRCAGHSRHQCEWGTRPGGEYDAGATSPFGAVGDATAHEAERSAFCISRQREGMWRCSPISSRERPIRNAVRCCMRLAAMWPAIFPAVWPGTDSTFAARWSTKRARRRPSARNSAICWEKAGSPWPLFFSPPHGLQLCYSGCRGRSWRSFRRPCLCVERGCGGSA